jgi:hypothetical protein
MNNDNTSKQQSFERKIPTSTEGHKQEVEGRAAVSNWQNNG